MSYSLEGALRRCRSTYLELTPMSHTIACPKCGRLGRIGSQQKKARCPQCGERFGIAGSSMRPQPYRLALGAIGLWIVVAAGWLFWTRVLHH